MVAFKLAHSGAINVWVLHYTKVTYHYQKFPKMF